MMIRKFQVNPSVLMLLLVLSPTCRGDEISLVSTYDSCDLTVDPSDNINEPIEGQLKAECADVPELSIRGYGVLQIPTGYCSLMPNLTRFAVHGTSADRFAGAFKDNECQSLKYLELSGNKLTELPVTPFRTLKNLDTLSLSYNRLENLAPDTFTGLEKLTDLSLLSVGITKVPTDLFKPLTNLQVVSLSENNLKVLDLNLFSTNAMLVGLSCNECELTSIIPATSPLHLEYLQLNTNRLTNIALLNGFTSLNGLELTGNADLILDGAEFASFPNLTSLHLGKDSLNRYKNYGKFLAPTLTYLYINGNNLRTLDLEQLGHLKNLEYLNADDNGLRALDIERLSSVLPKLARIDIEENEFTRKQIEAKKEFLSNKFGF